MGNLTATEIDGVRRISDPAMRVANAAALWLGRNGVSYESGGSTWEETSNGREIRQGCFFVGGPAPSMGPIRSAVRWALSEFGNGRVVLREIERSPGAIGTGWRILIGNREAGRPGPCPEIRLQRGSVGRSIQEGIRSVGDDGSFLVLGALALVAAAGAWGKTRRGSPFRKGSAYNVVGTTGDRNPIDYGGGAILDYGDGQIVWIVVEGIDIYPKDMIADEMEAYVERQGIEPDHELDETDDDDLHLYFPREVYEIDVDENTLLTFCRAGEEYEFATTLLKGLGLDEEWTPERIVEMAHSPDPGTRVIVYEFYAMDRGYRELAEPEHLTGAEIVERWPHFGGKVARHSFRGITWIEPWKHR